MSDDTEMFRQLADILTGIDTAEDNQYNATFSLEDLCKRIRLTFTSLNDLCSYSYTKDVKFTEYMKDRILQRSPIADIKIIEDYKHYVKYSRERTVQDDILIKKKTAVHQRVLKRFNYIVMKAFGPKCNECKSPNKNAYRTSCRCKYGICHPCLKTKCIIDTEKYMYKCSVCTERISIFKDVHSVHHSLKSLFNYTEVDNVPDKDADYLLLRPSKKPRTHPPVPATPAASFPLSLPVCL